MRSRPAHGVYGYATVLAGLLPALKGRLLRRRGWQSDQTYILGALIVLNSLAMEAAYRDGGPWLEAVLDYIGANLSLVREHLGALPDVALIEPDGAFPTLARVSGARNAFR